MENIKSYLANMETVSLTGDRFIHFKCRIQDELYKMSANPISGFETQIEEMYSEWRQLGTPKGSLLGYIAAINNLKNLIAKIEETQLPIF